jgi:hypothetical protein
MWCFFGDLCGAFVPGLEAGAAEVDAVEKELEGLGLELDALLGGLAGFGPAEAAFFEAFDGDPEAGAVEVEEFDASAIFVGEDKEGVVGGLGWVWWWRVASSVRPLKDLRISHGSRARKILRAAVPRLIMGDLLPVSCACAGL